MRANHHRSLRRLTRKLPVAAALSAFALAGCAGVEVLGNDSTLAGAGGNGGGVVVGGGGGGGGAHASAMLGQWTRALLVAGPDGDIHESRTTWEFRADGSAIRYVTAWNWTEGIYDTVSSVAQWATSGATVTITYIAGSTGTLSLAWRVDGDVLTLGPDQFARVR
ncbi:MAG TPA: hypothetical protein VG432_13590 [Gemmatimonadaceae bacterium]|nr:hypothetical protein [Gemmatimonadaceae bacterium]